MIVLSVLCLYFISAEAFNDPPLNPFLADSSWPVCHGNSYATDTSPMIGPNSNDNLLVEFINYNTLFSRINTYLPVSIVFENDKNMWATSVTSTFVLSNEEKENNHNKSTGIINSNNNLNNLKLSIYDNGVYDFSYHGAYSFISYDGVYFSSSQKGFGAYTKIMRSNDNTHGESEKNSVKVIKRGEFVLNLESYEKVIGVLPLFNSNQNKKQQVSSSLSNINEDNEDTCHQSSIKNDPTNGYIVVVTSCGKIAVVSRVTSLFGEDFYLASDILQISYNDLDFMNQKDAKRHVGSEISNSFAVDENGGIYFVSAKSLHYVQWKFYSPSSSSTSSSSSSIGHKGYLKHVWSEQYSENHQVLFPGRLGKGSGSTPSILDTSLVSSSTSKKNHLGKLLIITDGRSPMNILSYRIKDGKCVGNATVTFGQSQSSSSTSTSSSSSSSSSTSSTALSSSSIESTSEQSVVVLHNRAIVVQNWIDKETIPLFCYYFSSFLPGKARHSCNYLFGVKPRSGIEQFKINEINGQIKSEWYNKNIQCSSSIPAASTHLKNGLFYCIGMRSRKDKSFNNNNVDDNNNDMNFMKHVLLKIWNEMVLDLILPSNVFTLEGINMKDGSSNFTHVLGSGCFYNPNYAGIQIGSHHEIVVGTIGGVVKITPSSTSTSINKMKKDDININYKQIGDEWFDWIYPTTLSWFLNSHLNVQVAVPLNVIILLLIIKSVYFIYNLLCQSIDHYQNNIRKRKHNHASAVLSPSLTSSSSSLSAAYTIEETTLTSSRLSTTSLDTLPRTPILTPNINDDGDDDDMNITSNGGGGGIKELKEKLREETQARITARIASRSSTSATKRSVPTSEKKTKKSRND